MYEASLHKFRVDEIYEWLVVRPTRALAVVCEFLDTYLVDRLVIGVAKLPRLFGRDVLARYQNGLIQFYAAVSALSVAVLLLILVLLTQLLSHWGQLTLAIWPRGLTDGDTAGDHGPAPARREPGSGADAQARGARRPG